MQLPRFAEGSGKVPIVSAKVPIGFCTYCNGFAATATAATQWQAGDTVLHHWMRDSVSARSWGPTEEAARFSMLSDLRYAKSAVVQSDSGSLGLCLALTFLGKVLRWGLWSPR